MELAREKRNMDRLRIMNRMFKRMKVTDHLYDIVKVYEQRIEKVVKEDIGGLVTVLQMAESIHSEVHELIGEEEVVGKVVRNVFRQFSKFVYDTHFKTFLSKFSEVSLDEKKKFLGVTDKCYGVLKDLGSKMDVEVLMSMLTTFYFGFLDFVVNFCPNLERTILQKPDTAFENSAVTLCQILSLIDSQTGTISVFLSKKNIGFSDAIDFSVKTASHFIRILKLKCDALKSKSQLHSNIFSLKILDIIETEMKSWKKVSLKLKPGIEKSSANATKSYLYYCWSHLLAHKHSTEGMKSEEDIRRVY